MILVGENLNVMSKRMATAFRERDPGPIREEVLLQKSRGMDYIDINLGPAKKEGVQLLPWIVEVIQEVVDDMPLVLDTSNMEAIEAALKVCRKPPVINSIMCRPERYERLLPMAAEYNADFIALLWGPEGLPRDENERVILCDELIRAANEAGISNDRIWVDPIVTPVNIQQQQVMSVLAFQEMLPELFPDVKSICGLSNISNGIPTHLRAIVNQTYMVVLQRKGMMSVIANAMDDTLVNIARGKCPQIVELIYAAMDGDEPDLSGLTTQLQAYVKTVAIILGRSVYSDSWLDL